MDTVRLHGVPISNYQNTTSIDRSLTSENLVGSWILGSYFDVFCQAILYCMFYRYVWLYWKSEKGLRWVVVGLMVLTTLKTAQLFSITWRLTVVNWGQLSTGYNELRHTTWEVMNPMMVCILCLYVQSFFCYRLYSISRNYLHLVPIAALSVTSLVSVALAVLRFAAKDDTAEFRKWFGIHFATVFASDLLMTFITAYQLHYARRNGFPETIGLINAVMRLTFLTGLPATLCALVNMVLVLSGPQLALRIVIVNSPLPKLFAISMMWALIARIDLQKSAAENAESLLQFTYGGTTFDSTKVPEKAAEKENMV